MSLPFQATWIFNFIMIIGSIIEYQKHNQRCSRAWIYFFADCFFAVFMSWHQTSNRLGKMVHLKQTKTYQTFLRHRHITLFNGFWLVYSLADPVGHKKMNTLIFMVCISYHISCCICYFFICFSSFSDRNKVEFRTSLQAWKNRNILKLRLSYFERYRICVVVTWVTYLDI